METNEIEDQPCHRGCKNYTRYSHYIPDTAPCPECSGSGWVRPKPESITVSPAPANVTVGVRRKS